MSLLPLGWSKKARSRFAGSPRFVALGCLLAAMAAGTPAFADETADAEFERGLSLMDAGKPAEACAAFRAAERPGKTIATRYQMGRCLEEQGKHVDAHDAYLHAADLATREKDNDRAAAARDKAASAAAKAGQVRVMVSAKAEVDGLKVEVGPKTLRAAQWGHPVLVDPGKYRIVASAARHQPWMITIDVPSGGSPMTVQIPRLQLSSGGQPTEPIRPAQPGEPNYGIPDPGRRPGGRRGSGGRGAELPQYERRSGGLFAGGIVLTVVGGIALLGGAGYAGANVDDFGELDDEDATIAGGLAVGGLVGIAGGIVMMVIGGKRVPVQQQAFWFTPVVTQTQAGAMAGFRF